VQVPARAGAVLQMGIRVAWGLRAIMRVVGIGLPPSLEDMYRAASPMQPFSFARTQ